MQDEDDQKKRLTKWYESVSYKMMNGEREARTHVKSNKLDIDRARNENIRSWILGELKMKRNLKKYHQTDIRRFFNG